MCRLWCPFCPPRSGHHVYAGQSDIPSLWQQWNVQGLICDPGRAIRVPPGVDLWIWERNFLEGWDSRAVLTLSAASWGKPTCRMIPRTQLQSLELERDRVLTTLPALWVESYPQPGLVQDFHVSDTTKRILNNRAMGRGMTVPQRYSGQDFEPPVSFCGGETSSREGQSSSREEIVGDWETALGGVPTLHGVYHLHSFLSFHHDFIPKTPRIMEMT